MKTDDLIRGLSADRVSGMGMDRVWGLTLALAVIAAGVVFFATMGPRPDFGAAAETVRFIFKFIVTIVLAATAWLVLRRLSMPGGRGGLLPMVMAPVMLIAAVLLELAVLPSSNVAMSVIGKNAMVCLVAIPAIGLLPLVIFLAGLRHGAPERPGLAGMVAGVLAGAVAATFYAAHCTDDSPLFVVTWYPLAIAIVAVAGAVAARIVVRW